MQRQYVGIDLHRRRSVIVRKDVDGQLLSKVHIDNDPIALADAVAAAGPNPKVVVAGIGVDGVVVSAADRGDPRRVRFSEPCLVFDAGACSLRPRPLPQRA